MTSIWIIGFFLSRVKSPGCMKPGVRKAVFAHAGCDGLKREDMQNARKHSVKIFDPFPHRDTGDRGNDPAGSDAYKKNKPELGKLTVP